MIYRQIQAAHVHASPDGPWFFIIARSLAESKSFQLMGITDTAMLRPQVFALQEGEVSIGLICSEKQAIDATLASLASEDPRFTPVADIYWNARGGSHTDGGGVSCSRSARRAMAKVGQASSLPKVRLAAGLAMERRSRLIRTGWKPVLRATATISSRSTTSSALQSPHCRVNRTAIFRWPRSSRRTPPRTSRPSIAPLPKPTPRACSTSSVAGWKRSTTIISAGWSTKWPRATAESSPAAGIEAFTSAIDRRYATGAKKRSSVLTILRGGLGQIFERQPLCGEGDGGTHVRIDWQTRGQLRGPRGDERTLLIDARGFAPEGDECDSRLAVTAYHLGWRHIVHYNSRGTRFHGVGFGPQTDGLRIDCYDNPGDYLGSGIDGLEIYVHGNAQDQLCQISKRGKLVVYGDVGQTFLYGAKGGTIFVLGNAAGRPMINAVGKPRVIINGTALDFLAESFMAGDPREGGGFAIVNGLRYDPQGKLVPLERPYPGSNLLSLASGGAIYVRDPYRTLVDEQLNGGVYRPLGAADWKLILPYLEENQRLFGIRVQQDLLTVDGVLRTPADVYRKVMPRKDAEIEMELEGIGA